jgi:glycosyltransferase involved in cell wall biosynthesis
MRVGLLTYALDRPLSGISRYTLELARALALVSNGPEVVLLTAGGAGPLAAQNHFRRALLRGCRRWPAFVTLGSVWMPLLAQNEQLDVVHDPTGATPFFFGAGKARTVVTIHDVFAWSCPGNSTLLDTLIYHHWLPRVVPRVDAVITVSQASKADIVRYLKVVPSKVRVVYRWVHAALRPSPRDEIARAKAQYRLPDAYILFLGSIEKRKNVHGLLRAYAHLRQMGEPRPLVVVGVRRRNSKVARTMRDLDLEQHVILTGYVPDADLPALYSGADLFVFPSLYEGFGLPPLEAMACGTPVVCSNAGSLPEVVGDAAIMVDPYDVEGLAEAMQRVLTDADLREELRAKGLARARHFTWEQAARETIAVYQKVLE